MTATGAVRPRRVPLAIVTAVLTALLTVLSVGAPAGATEAGATEAGATEAGATLRVVVVGPAGEPIDRAALTLLRWDEGSATWESSLRHTDPAGTFEWTALAAGTYRLAADRMGYLYEYFPEATTEVEAEDIVLRDGDVRTIDFQLDAAGDISGRAFLPVGADASRIRVDVHRWDAPAGVWSIVHTSSTRHDGRYGTTLLGAGTYRVGFRDLSGALKPVFYGGTTLDTATDLVIDPLGLPGHMFINLEMEWVVAPEPEPEPKAIKRLKAPKVTGKAKVGRTLRVSRGTWKPGAVTVKYQWFVRKGGKVVPIAKSTKSSLKLTRSLLGKKVRVRLVVSAAGHTSYPHTSGWSKKVARR